METDASRMALGAVLPQGDEDGTLHPMAYATRTLKLNDRYSEAT